MSINPEDSVRIWLIRPVSLLLLCAWVITLGFSLYTNDYESLKIVSVPFGMMVGYVFGVTTIRIGRRGNGNGNGNGKK